MPRHDSTADLETTAHEEVLAFARLSSFLIHRLQAAFTVHDNLHETDPAAFAAAAPRIKAIACGGESKVDAALIAGLPALRIISVMGVGYDGIDVAAARERGVMVTHTPGVLDDDVADLAIGLMLCAARQLPAADRFVRAGLWQKGRFPLTRKLSGSRLGLVGMGRIGQAIAKRAAAFNMTIAYTARNRKEALPWTFHPNAKTLAAHSDFLVVIIPGGESTRNLIDAEVLEALGPQGILVNVARGSVVDEDALVDALERGLIAGAALDVHGNEPDVSLRLRALPQVVLTPHIGSSTDKTRQAMADLAFDNLQRHLSGLPALTPVPELRP